MRSTPQLNGKKGNRQKNQVTVGLGGAKRIDFVSLDWSDGVYQTELDLEAGKIHRIVETQRQISSCPVLFAWNGKIFAFVSDLLGVGGIGYTEGLRITRI